METEQRETNDENLIILEAKSYNLSLENEEYELTVNLTEKYIEFKLDPKNAIYNFIIFIIKKNLIYPLLIKINILLRNFRN